MGGGGGQDLKNVGTKKISYMLLTCASDSETYTEREHKLIIYSECHSLKSTNYNELYLDTCRIRKIILNKHIAIIGEKRRTTSSKVVIEVYC